ncbi:MAG: DNA polymerase III subunit gamma/tau, partial [Bacteroidales bacterium]|nr:DNA polymerase III subunit gamma/tau [Bacteroidales bacterium]
FIMATTEKHKILPTILSRCQVYDFKRINDNDIVRHLQFVAQNEGVLAEEDALRVVAAKADGALRDALSIFDQLVSFTGKNITYKDTITNLNVLDVDNYFQVMDIVLSDDVSGALLLLDDILAKGFDAQNFISGLASHIRNLLLAQNPGTVQLLQVSDPIRAKLQAQAQKADRMLLTRALELANQCDFNYKSSNNKRLSVELCLMQINANYVYKRQRLRQSQER